jgi:hypothetical protein
MMRNLLTVLAVAAITVLCLPGIAPRQSGPDPNAIHTPLPVPPHDNHHGLFAKGYAGSYHTPSA